MENQSLYNDEFYKHQVAGSYLSAERILPFFIENLSVKSIVDFGCGTGSWLKVAQNFDKEIKVLGLDFGDNQKRLLIKNSEFKKMDLTKKIRLNKEFDLVMSLEVAEHLPKENAETFIQSLCAHGKKILFSAAFAMQGGTGHINENTLSYWKAIFNAEGYEMVEVRPLFWTDNKIEFWYRQNIALFIKSSEKDTINKIRTIVNEKGDLTDILHPIGFWSYANSSRVASENLNNLIAHTVLNTCNNLLAYEELTKNVLNPFDKNQIIELLSNFDNDKKKKIEKILKAMEIIY